MATGAPAAHAGHVGERGADCLLSVDPRLRFLLAPRLRRYDAVEVAPDGTSSLLHVVESLGIPRTEVGSLLRAGQRVPAGYLPRPGDLLAVQPVARPQPGAERGFLLDVHLGGLARRLRLLGVDALYRNRADDRELLAAAIDTGRILLTCDRGLLRRRLLPAGALVRGRGTEAQLADVLDRFAPQLTPWTRCPTCNGSLAPVAKDHIAHLLPPGTRASYEDFARCRGCGRLYWRGAHYRALSRVVAAAREGAADR